MLSNFCSIFLYFIPFLPSESNEFIISYGSGSVISTSPQGIRKSVGLPALYRLS